MKLFALLVVFAGLIGSGVAAGMSGDDSGPPVTMSSAVVGQGSSGAEFVSGLGFSCDTQEWRVGFNLGRSAMVTGRLDRRVTPTPVSWSVVRRFAVRKYAAGARFIQLGTHRSGTYRIRLSFTATSGATAVRWMTFKAGCTNPPPPRTTPTLPGGTLPMQ